MKKYVLYTWHSDNGEDGIGVCYAKDFTTNIGYYGSTGYYSCQSHFLIDFDHPYDAAKYLRAVYNLSVDEMEKVEENIIYCISLFPCEEDDLVYENEDYVNMSDEDWEQVLNDEEDFDDEKVFE